MTNVNLNLRNPKENSPQSIWAIFYVDKVRRKMNTNFTVHPDDWSFPNQKTKSGHSESALVNKLLKEQQDFISDYIEGLKGKKKRFYMDELQRDFNHYFKIGEVVPEKEGQVTDFIAFINKYIDDRKDVSEGTVQVYQATKRNIILAFELAPAKMIKEWTKMGPRQKKLNPDFLQPNKLIEFDEINVDWMKKFNKWLLTAKYTTKEKGVEVEKFYAKNTVAKNIRKAKEFCAAAGMLIKDKSFSDVTAPEEDADTIHCSWEEIDKLKALELDSLSLQGRVRNKFVFNCYLGLRYSDLSRLEQTRFVKKDDGLYLKIRLKKTGTLVEFPVLKSAEEILKIYDYQLPEISEQTYNEEIKKIAQMAGIDKIEYKRVTRGGRVVESKIPKYEMIGSHTGRRSFATNFTEDRAPIPQLMLVTGHTTEKSFRKYVKIQPESHFTEFKMIGSNR